MFTLPQLARLAGGRHATADYPRIPVQPIGVLTHVTYLTMKRDDAIEDGWVPSQYIHNMGEEGGIPPILAVDGHGRLWIAGGSYRVVDGGIIQ